MALTEKNKAKLQEIVDATNSNGFTHDRPKDPHIKKLLGLEMVEQNDELLSDDGLPAFRATAKGIEALNDVEETEEVEETEADLFETETETETETEETEPEEIEFRPEVEEIEFRPEVEETQDEEPEETGFEIETGVPIPKIKRGGRGNYYPFDKMELEQSFHVSPKEGEKDILKRLASTVSSANNRYKDSDGNRTKKFIVRRVDETDPKGTGARVFRVL